MDHPVTQKQVAQAAGVSQATVSLALRGLGGGAIPEETLQRIAAAAQALGYVPNRFATALRTNRTMTICCIVPDITNPFYPLLVRGVQAVAEENGYDVIMVNSDGLRSREQRFVEMAAQRRFDGILGVFFSLNARDLAPLAESNLPIVRIEVGDKSGGPLPIDNVFTDNFDAARDMTDFLISKGHRNIAMIAGRGGPEEVRVNGYRHALDRAGLIADVIHDAEYNEHGGMRAAQTLFARQDEATAILAANDLMAIGAMKMARTIGKSIPGDLAIAGFDDIPASSLATPALTSVALFQERLGAEAARQLIGRLDGSRTGPGASIRQGYELIIREST